MTTLDSAADLRHLGVIWAAWHGEVPFINDPLRPRKIWVFNPSEPKQVQEKDERKP